MTHLWSRLRRRMLPPSVDVFDGQLSLLASKVDSISADLGAITTGVGDKERIERAEMQAELRQAIREIRWRQDEIHAADLKAASDKSALLSLMGTSPTQKDLREVLRFISPESVDGFAKIRVGSRYDGGYVMVDDLENVTRAFSLGISTNDDWDAQMADRGAVVDQYDHSIKQAPTSHERLNFFPLKVTATGEADTISLDEIATGLSSRSASVLKADIEGSEWDVFDRTSPEIISCFTQIICEFHWLHRLIEVDFYDTAKRVLSKLARTHQSVHVHGNNCGPMVNLSNMAIPTVLEVTYARRGTYKFAPTGEVFPTDLDAPNDHTVPDIFLGSMRF